MKIFPCLSLCLCLLPCRSVAAHTPYEIDLSAVTLPQLHYLQLGHPGPQGQEIRINNLYFEQAGQPRLPVMGELHYGRMHPDYWRDALLKMKATGINIVSTYCLWNLQEETEGHLSWEGRYDLRRFVSICKELGLMVHLRIGPYCNAEIRNGGLPDWLIRHPHLETRSNHPLYLEYVGKWYREIYQQVKGLLYKDGGPIIAVQLENEYVKRGQIVSHLRQLKKMALETGFDVPLYTMTHWMDSEYPKGEIIPYAGFYIEAPWTTSGKAEIPTGNFEFFTYNRLSDNIGTDIIRMEGKVESLSGKNNESPFFTCEVGVGTTAFYHRRAVVPQEMAGETINLRLGCGTNLMGYYMYAGGTNPVGQLTTLQSSGPRVSYDYQAPIREFGTLGTVMPEVKKYNYFMNDFGGGLAPAVAYLPLTNKNRDSLQWAVRYDGEKGYLFCSNYLYKHPRQDFAQVQFRLRLHNGETLTVPRTPTTVKGGTYFLWPFNLPLDGILLKHATAQPICTLTQADTTTCFFFEDDGIPAEYAIAKKNIRHIRTRQAECTREKNGYFISRLTAGSGCTVEIEKNDGSTLRIITLTEAESDRLWKLATPHGPVVALSASTLTADTAGITVIDARAQASVSLFSNGRFHEHRFHAAPRSLACQLRQLPPMHGSATISPTAGNALYRDFRLLTLTDVDKAFLRYRSADTTLRCTLNDSLIHAEKKETYQWANVTDLIQKGNNRWTFAATAAPQVRAELEILLKNGERRVWHTDATWLSARDHSRVHTVPDLPASASYSPSEHLALYEIHAPRPAGGAEETRLFITYFGDVANLYQNGRLVADSYYDGTEWIVSLDRLPAAAETHPLTVRINGLNSKDAPIYFEKNVDPAKCVLPSIARIKAEQEYRFHLPLP